MYKRRSKNEAVLEYGGKSNEFDKLAEYLVVQVDEALK